MNIITNNNILCTLATAALDGVYDPEIGLSVVALGLIYQIDFDYNQKKIYCTMTLTTQFCPIGQSIVDSVKVALERTFSEYKTIVHLTFTPAWNHEQISEEGKSFLNR